MISPILSSSELQWTRGGGRCIYAEKCAANIQSLSKLHNIVVHIWKCTFLFFFFTNVAEVICLKIAKFTSQLFVFYWKGKGLHLCAVPFTPWCRSITLGMWGDWVSLSHCLCQEIFKMALNFHSVLLQNANFMGKHWFGSLESLVSSTGWCMVQWCNAMVAPLEQLGNSQWWTTSKSFFWPTSGGKKYNLLITDKNLPPQQFWI